MAVSQKTKLARQIDHRDTRPSRALIIGIVNNMPDAAFDATTRRLLSLVHGGAEGLPIEVRGYRLPHLGTEQASPNSSLLRYEDLHALYDEPPDALFVTGARPTATDITLEPFWGDLAKLIKWACERVPSTLLSCLASHAAAVALHGIERTPLPSKRCGVFEQEVDRSHFLMRRLGVSVSLPHSRFNDISSEDLLRHGYDILVASADSGWTVATREESGRLLVLLQGHPEYSSTTLLREYRRDVNEYLQGTTLVYPEIPVGYLDRAGEERLLALRGVHQCAQPAVEVSPFPFRPMCSYIRADWQDTASQLFANWVVDAGRRCGLDHGSEMDRERERNDLATSEDDDRHNVSP
jgi:homoserine O-succinyltransferase/O-acetyltransferase